jgi:hypothetical protein
MPRDLDGGPDSEVVTIDPADNIRGRGDLVMKSCERIFRARVPPPARACTQSACTGPRTFAELGEGVEARGMRWMQAERRFIDRLRHQPRLRSSSRRV